MVWPLKTKIRAFRLRSRASLIAATVLLQAAVIGLGWLASLHLVRSDVASKAHDRMMDETTRAVESLNMELSRSASAPVEFQGPGWDAVQSLVESYKMPKGAMLFLLDQHGRVVCHPDLRRAPNLRNLDYSDQIVSLAPGGDIVALAGTKPGGILTGETDLLSGPVSVAVGYNQAARVHLVVYQPMAEMAAMEARLTSGFMLWGGLAGVGVLLATVAGSILLVPPLRQHPDPSQPAAGRRGRAPHAPGPGDPQRPDLRPGQARRLPRHRHGPAPGANLLLLRTARERAHGFVPRDRQGLG